MTMKSKIGFGYHKDSTVADLFIMYKELELLRLYYGFENIDFNDEIKDRLFINKERQIKKPGNLRQPKLHPELKLCSYDIIAMCLIDFNEKNNTEAYKMLRGSFMRSQKLLATSYKKKQWGEKAYKKSVMSWINQHYGINR